MRSVLVLVRLLTIYLLLMFVWCRILDLIPWYVYGISSTQIVDPLLLSVRQLKQLLENRGVSYAGYAEKKDLAHLVEASGDVVQSEVEELSQVRGGLEADKSSRERLPTPPPPTRFKGGHLFYEEMENTKDSVWLVQVVPDTEPLLDDYSWRTVCSQVVPFDIRTGVLDCRSNRWFCRSKGWHYPLLLLALPKGTRAKDRVVLKTYTSTRPQTIVEWVRGQLSVYVKRIHDIDELTQQWLQDESSVNYISSKSSSPSANSENVKVLWLTHHTNPPSYLPALSIKFSGRIKFGMFSIKKEDSDTLRKKLKMLDLQIPSYIIIMPDRTVVYDRRRSEHFNFASMNLFLRTVHPEMNDVILCSLLLINMLVILQIFQVSSRLWWKHAQRCLWTAVSYNFWLFLVWLLILAPGRFSFTRFLADKGLAVAQYLSLTEIGSLLRADLQVLTEHPYLLLFTFIVYGFMSMWSVRWQNLEDAVTERDAVLQGQADRPAVPNLHLRPAVNERDAGLEWLADRPAVPNLHLRPAVNERDAGLEWLADSPAVPNLHLRPAVNERDAGLQWLADRPAVPNLHLQPAVNERDAGLQWLADRPAVPNLHLQPAVNERDAGLQWLADSPAVPNLHLRPAVNERDVGLQWLTEHLAFPNLYLRPAVNERDVGLQWLADRPAVPNLHLRPAVNERDAGLQWLTEYLAVPNSHLRPHTSKEYVKNLPVWRFRGSYPLDSEPDAICTICLQSYKHRERLCRLPCDHIYHKRCIKRWLCEDSDDTHNNCPICRWPAYKPREPHPHRE